MLPGIASRCIAPFPGQLGYLVGKGPPFLLASVGDPRMASRDLMLVGPLCCQGGLLVHSWEGGWWCHEHVQKFPRRRLPWTGHPGCRLGDPPATCQVTSGRRGGPSEA